MPDLRLQTSDFRTSRRIAPSNFQPLTSNIPRASTYRTAGVDIPGAEAWLKRMAPLIRSTHRPGVLPDRGQFAGLFRLASLRMRDPVLVASTDGVGTKRKVAQLVGAHEAIGVDVVAMNVNDVVTYGATPIFFLDYIAVGQVQPRLMSSLLRGIVNGCRESGCALLGGETAEMPGVYSRGEYDVAGFCVGVVERAKMLTGSRVRAGDRIVGLASSGVHANGFSLVRRIFTAAQLKSLGRTLLTPTRIYVAPLLRARHSVPIHAIAHVTGGGLSRRLEALVQAAPRVRPQLWWGRWSIPPIFQKIQQAGAITMGEMSSTFNMGIGMALACPASETARLIRLMRHAKIDSWVIGAIEQAR
mgnify:FL=1